MKFPTVCLLSTKQTRQQLLEAKPSPSCPSRLTTPPKPRPGPPPESFDDYSVVKGLGQGAFGVVVEVENMEKHSGKRYAMKCLSKRRHRTQEAQDGLRREVHILTRIEPSPFLLRCHSSFETPSSLFLIMDLLTGGDLFFQLDQTIDMGREGFTEDQARVILAETSLGIIHLHRCGFLHLDIKIENIMLDGLGHVRIVDFGLAAEVPEQFEVTMKPRGSLLYMAPELVSRSIAGRFTDWWAMGILAFELFTARSPWSTISNIRQIRAEVLALPIPTPAGVTSSACEFIHGLLDRNHERRLGSANDEDVLSSPFFSGIDLEAMKRGETAPALVPREGAVVVEPEDAANALAQYERRYLLEFNACRDAKKRGRVDLGQ
jgi:serine/threonine protein kinase